MNFPFDVLGDILSDVGELFICLISQGGWKQKIFFIQLFLFFLLCVVFSGGRDFMGG